MAIDLDTIRARGPCEVRHTEGGMEYRLRRPDDGSLVRCEKRLVVPEGRPDEPWSFIQSQELPEAGLLRDAYAKLKGTTREALKS